MSIQNYKDRQGWSEDMPRFWIEQRIGCIAIIDSNITKKIDGHLDSKTDGVVWFKMGKQTADHSCPICNKTCYLKWEISEDLINEAIKEADKLNNEGDIIKE